ncbi:unnamed protein product [Calicophoron daubneyi]|uniref:Protein YIPF n=1 Tax=Calicophoron daubneyi TaxID=300641 RepID=A0AAV2TA45_CALDB
MSLKFTNDDYVRVPLSNNREEIEDSDPDIEGVIKPSSSKVPEGSPSEPTLWSFEFYQKHFDVDTSQVVRRLAFSLVPNPRTNFVQHILKPHADLYGPFWIATTLILAAAVGGNISNYLQSRGQSTSWHYEFGKVTLASTIIYVYWWLIPLAIAAFLYIRAKKDTQSAQEEDQDTLLTYSESRDRTRRSVLSSAYKFVDLLSVYGYSLAVFVPASILWTIPNTILQWIMTLVAMVISTAFIVFALFPFLRKSQPKFAGPLIVVLVVLHCLFSIGLMMTFFHGSTPAAKLEDISAPVANVPPDAPKVAPPPQVNPVKRDVLTQTQAAVKGAATAHGSGSGGSATKK